jgi:hypothetical protein
MQEVKKQKVVQIPESYNITITNEREELFNVKPPEIPEEQQIEEINITQIANYTENPNANLRITLIEIGNAERLDLISKSDFDILIASINEDSLDKAVTLIKSYADDIEILILPFPRTINESIKIRDKIGVAKIIIPNYNYNNMDYLNKTKNVQKVSNGAIINNNGIKLEFTTPFSQSLFSGDENNALSFYVQDRGLTLFFGNDIVEGAIGKIVSDNLIKKLDVIILPSYGEGRAGGNYMKLFIDKTMPTNAIFEGKQIVLSSIEQNDSRAGLINYLTNKGVNIYFVGNGTVSIFYDGNAYNINQGNK